MTTRTDARYAAVAAIVGFSTHINDMLVPYYQDGGAVSDDINDAEYEFLVAQGATLAHLSDMWLELLTAQGYTGALDDMLLEFWENGGSFGPQPAKFVAASSDVATNGTTVTVTFNKAVSGSDVLGFTLRRNGVPVSFTGPGAIVSQTTWVLTVTTGGPVDIGDVFAVLYDDGPGTLITDENALPVLSFGPTQITNNSTQGAPSPLPVTKTVDAAGTTFTVVFDQVMTGNPALGFTLSGGHVLSAGNLVSDTITWTVDQVFTGEVLTLAYDSGVGDMAGLAQPLATFANAPVTNNSAIGLVNLVSANVDVTGLILTAVFDQNLAGDPNVGFTATNAISNGVIAGANITWDIAQVYLGNVITLSYAPGDIAGTPSGDLLLAFTGAAVTNNSTEVLPFNEVIANFTGIGDQAFADNQVLGVAEGVSTGSITINLANVSSVDRRADIISQKLRVGSGGSSTSNSSYTISTDDPAHACCFLGALEPSDNLFWGTSSPFEYITNPAGLDNDAARRRVSVSAARFSSVLGPTLSFRDASTGIDQINNLMPLDQALEGTLIPVDSAIVIGGFDINQGFSLTDHYGYESYWRVTGDPNWVLAGMMWGDVLDGGAQWGFDQGAITNVTTLVAGGFNTLALSKSYDWNALVNIDGNVLDELNTGVGGPMGGRAPSVVPPTRTDVWVQVGDVPITDDITAQQRHQVTMGAGLTSKWVIETGAVPHLSVLTWQQDNAADTVNRMWVGIISGYVDSNNYWRTRAWHSSARGSTDRILAGVVTELSGVNSTFLNTSVCDFPNGLMAHTVLYNDHPAGFFTLGGNMKSYTTNDNSSPSIVDERTEPMYSSGTGVGYEVGSLAGSAGTGVLLVGGISFKKDKDPAYNTELNKIAALP